MCARVCVRMRLSVCFVFSRHLEGIVFSYFFSFSSRYVIKVSVFDDVISVFPPSNSASFKLKSALTQSQIWSDFRVQENMLQPMSPSALGMRHPATNCVLIIMSECSFV